MKCLAVNTATTVLSLAIVEDDKVLHYFETPETRDQGNLLLQHIQDGLKKNKINYQDLDVLAVVTGPGSFTGIRIGLAAMRGIALAANKPLIGLTSFDMFTHFGDEVNIVAVESWRDELYFAALDAEGHPYMECMNETPERFAAKFSFNLPGEHDIVISGDAAAAVQPLFPNAKVIDKPANAGDVAQLALARFKKGGVFPKPVPYYLREADVTISPKLARSLKDE
jgi:tRNA threonylcarbamoyladenosine biosynthesis protein TsaB